MAIIGTSEANLPEVPIKEGSLTSVPPEVKMMFPPPSHIPSILSTLFLHSSTRSRAARPDAYPLLGLAQQLELRKHVTFAFRIFDCIELREIETRLLKTCVVQSLNTYHASATA